MKKFLKIVTIFLILSMMVISISFATTINDIEMTQEYENVLNLMSSQNDLENIEGDVGIINNDLFLSEDIISVEEDVNGNLYLFGDVVNVSSRNIDGNIFIFGNDITINSNINGSIYVIGSSLNIAGSMNDIYAVAEKINILENAECRDIKVIGANMKIAGIVDRDVYSVSGEIEVLDSASIKGVLSSPNKVLGNTDRVNEIQIIEDETVNIEKTEEEMQKIGESIGKGISIFLFISAEMTALIIIAIIVAFSSKKKIQTSDLKENVVMDTVYGLAYFGLAVAIIIALLFTIIGIPVSVILALVLWFIFWKITIPVASIEIAKAVLKQETKSKVLVWIVAFVIFTLVQCINFVPTIGGIIKGIVSLYGFGYMIRNIIRKNKSDDSNQEVEILA